MEAVDTTYIQQLVKIGVSCSTLFLNAGDDVPS